MNLRKLGDDHETGPNEISKERAVCALYMVVGPLGKGIPDLCSVTAESFDRSPDLVRIRCVGSVPERTHPLWTLSDTIESAGYNCTRIGSGFVLSLTVEEFDALIEQATQQDPERFSDDNARHAMAMVMFQIDKRPLSMRTRITTQLFSSSGTLVRIDCTGTNPGQPQSLHYYADMIRKEGYNCMNREDGFSITLPVSQFDAMVSTGKGLPGN